MSAASGFRRVGWLFAALVGGGAEAGTVVYSTAASQLCVGAPGCGVATQTIGGGTGVTVAFEPVAPSTVIAGVVGLRTFTSFGQLRISCVGGGTNCASQSLAGLNLYINIAQTVPVSGNTALPGASFTGSLRGNASNATLTLVSGTAVALGLVSYRLDNASLPLVPPSTGAGVVTIQGEIIDLTGEVVFRDGFE